MLPVVVDALAFVALPCVVWRCCGRVVPLAVLPVLTGLGLAVPCALGTLAALALVTMVEAWRPAAIGAGPAALAIGLCLAVSALPVLVGIVRELAPSDRPLGRMALRLAAIDDAVLWTGLGALMLTGRLGGPAAGWEEAVAAVVLLGLAIGGRRLAEWNPASSVGVWGLAALWLAAGAWSTGTLGLHALLGAYLGGALLPAGAAGRLPAERLGLLALTLLAPLFFGHRGLAIDASVFGWGALAVAAGLMLLAAASKIAAVWLVPPAVGMPVRDRLALGSLLQCKGLMEIVAATMLRDQGMLTETAYAALVTLAVFSTVLTVPLFRMARRGVRPAVRRPGPASYRGMP